MEEFSENTEYPKKIQQQLCEEQLSLIQLEATEQSGAALQRAMPRIRHTIRGTDLVFFHGVTCAVVLPATPIAGAQVVARRLSALLVDVEYSTHVLYGAAAQAALSRLRYMRAVEVSVDVASPGNGIRSIGAPLVRDEAQSALDAGSASLPHLAYLAHYPSLRLFHHFPYALACQYQCVPVGAERGVLTIATCHHLEPPVIAHLQTETRRTIFQVYCEMSIIEDVLRYWERMLPVTVGADVSRPAPMYRQ
ncbi:MAG TPA: hypothetical protein VKR42_02545 [Ktedonobacteraceae bacterium]|nr:hypothetical protein [Ktedonobacteraceae bacterium]